MAEQDPDENRRPAVSRLSTWSAGIVDHRGSEFLVRGRV